MSDARLWTAPRVIHFGSERGYEQLDPDRKEYERLKEKFAKEEDSDD